MIAFNCNALTLIVGTWWLDAEGKWLGPTFECRLLSPPITPAYIGSWLHWLDLLSRKQRHCVELAFMIHSFKDIIRILMSIFCSLSCKNNKNMFDCVYIHGICSYKCRKKNGKIWHLQINVDIYQCVAALREGSFGLFYIDSMWHKYKCTTWIGLQNPLLCCILIYW